MRLRKLLDKESTILEHYPVELPRYEKPKPEYRDWSRLLFYMILVGLTVVTSSNIYLLFTIPDRDIALYITGYTLLSSLIPTIYLIYTVGYRINWLRKNVEDVLPYFTIILNFLVKSGREFVDALKYIVDKNLFKYISYSLREVKYIDVLHTDEVRRIVASNPSNIFRQAINESCGKTDKISRWIDTSVKKP